MDTLDADYDVPGKFPAPNSPEYHFLVRELVGIIANYTAEILDGKMDLTEEEAACAAIAWRLANIIYPSHGLVN